MNGVTVILLFEGTDNEPHRNPSSISWLNGHLINSALQGQVVHLVTGSGTHGCGLLRGMCRISGLDSWSIVREQKRWLRAFMNRQGLRAVDITLYVFGFSRGAFQARLFTSGLFRENLRGAHWPSVEYLGLIDAVPHIWFPRVRAWDAIPTLTQCRHAVAIHEYRRKFAPLLLEDAAPNHEEQCFLGAHSDVGWAYNGSRHERIYPFGRCFPCCGFRVNRARTKSLGKIALSWIVDPVGRKMKFRNPNDPETFTVRTLESAIQATSDYANLLSFFYLVVHDSTHEASNAFGFLRPRTRRIPNAQYHYSARSAIDILESGILPLILVDLPTRSRGCCRCRNSHCHRARKHVDLVGLLLRTLKFDQYDSDVANLSIRHRGALAAACRHRLGTIYKYLRGKGYRVSP